MLSNEAVFLLLRIISALLLIGGLVGLFVVFWKNAPPYPAESDLSRTRRTFGRVESVEKAEDGYRPVHTPYPLLPLTSIGRAPTNTIPIDDHFASSEHALIALRGGQWWLEDRGSRNGTLLNDIPVMQPMIITEGDLIAIGSTCLRVTFDTPPAEEASR
jgi:pSer/pThr/pTyr-binding forkhead associated (FHA) protein